MLESIPVAITIATALGTLAGLGVGGGSLLILWLTLVLSWAYPQARILNLLFFLPGAVISTALRLKNKKLSFSKVWPAALCGCVGAALAYFMGNVIDTAVLKKLFGGLLLATGIRELLYRPRKAK